MSGCERNTLAWELGGDAPAVWRVERRKAQHPRMRDRPGMSGAGHIPEQEVRPPNNRGDLSLARGWIGAMWGGVGTLQSNHSKRGHPEQRNRQTLRRHMSNALMKALPRVEGCHRGRD